MASIRSPRPVPEYVEPRMAIAMKAMIRELAHVLGNDDVVAVAHAAGTDHGVLRLQAELEDRQLRKAETEHKA